MWGDMKKAGVGSKIDREKQLNLRIDMVGSPGHHLPQYTDITVMIKSV